MARVEHIGDAELWLGDCLEILPTLGDAYTIVTDPPYGTGYAARGGKRQGTIEPGSGHVPEWDKFDTTWLSAAGVGIPMAVFTALTRTGDLWAAMGADGLLMYVKTNPSPIGSSCEPCVTRGFSRKGPQHICAYNSFNGQEHETQKPVEVMLFVCSKSPAAGGPIVDPFMGSGTTGVACANLGRKFIGIEICEQYFDIACERIDAAYRQGRLFE